MSTPRVTVVTPTRDRLALLLETMASVKAQTLSDWEHVIVDDGSEDATEEVLAAAMADDPRIRYFRRTGEIAGANVCRNLGMLSARSDLLVFLDSDDLLEPDCLENRVRFMERNLDIDFAVFQMGAFLRRPGDLGRRVPEDLHRDDLLCFLLFELPWQTSAPIWRREALRRLGGFDESLPSWQDIDLHVRALVAGLRYLKIPVVDYHMRWQEDPAKVSTLQLRSAHHLRVAGAIFEKFERLVSQGPGMTWVRQRAFCSLYFFVAERWMDLGRTAEAIEFWGRIRKRRLGSVGLYAAGVLMLRLQAPYSPARAIGSRLCHKWKGWVRLRTNPELVL